MCLSSEGASGTIPLFTPGTYNMKVVFFSLAQKQGAGPSMVGSSQGAVTAAADYDTTATMGITVPEQGTDCSTALPASGPNGSGVTKTTAVGSLYAPLSSPDAGNHAEHCQRCHRPGSPPSSKTCPRRGAGPVPAKVLQGIGGLI